MPHFDPNEIKRIARKKGVRQSTLAEAIYVDRSTMDRWLNGKSNIPAHVLPLFASALQCNIMDFFTDK